MVYTTSKDDVDDRRRIVKSRTIIRDERFVTVGTSSTVLNATAAVIYFFIRQQRWSMINNTYTLFTKKNNSSARCNVRNKQIGKCLLLFNERFFKQKEENRTSRINEHFFFIRILSYRMIHQTFLPYFSSRVQILINCCCNF